MSLARDGTFTVRATSPGFSMARIEACRAEPPGTCVITTLVVVVSTGPEPPPPGPGPATAPCLPWLPAPWQPPC